MSFQQTETYPELIIDTSPLNLDGTNISIADSGLPWVLTGKDPVATAAHRSALGGVPPYTYASSDPRIASVDNNGTVRSQGNGIATIKVTDQVGQTKQFVVAASNVVRYLYSKDTQFDSISDFQSWIDANNGLPIEPEHAKIHMPILNLKFVPDSEDYVRYMAGVRAHQYGNHPLMYCHVEHEITLTLPTYRGDGVSEVRGSHSGICVSQV